MIQAEVVKRPGHQWILFFYCNMICSQIRLSQVHGTGAEVFCLLYCFFTVRVAILEKDSKLTIVIQTIKMKADERKRSMEKWVCTICGYVYDPAQGDPDNGIDPGTAWADVADDWLCPICGASKDDFEKEE